MAFKRSDELGEYSLGLMRQQEGLAIGIKKDDERMARTRLDLEETVISGEDAMLATVEQGHLYNIIRVSHATSKLKLLFIMMAHQLNWKTRPEKATPITQSQSNHQVFSLVHAPCKSFMLRDSQHSRAYSVTVESVE